MRRVLLLLLAGTMLAYCAVRLRVTSDVTRFLPESGEVELALLSRRLVDSDLTRAMVLCVDAGDEERSLRAARELEQRLRGHPDVTWLRGGVDPAQLRELYELYFPRRNYFLSDRPERIPGALLSEEALRDRARALKRELALPTSMLLERVAAEDPLGAFQRVLERIQGSEPELRLVDGHFFSRDGRFALIFLGTKSSGFDSRSQGHLLDAIALAREEIERSQGAPLRLEQSGVNRFAVYAERSIRRDILTIAACSFAGISLLFLSLARSPHNFLLVMLPPLAGMLAATTCVLLVRGEIDGLTMAFGVALIGVAIDYPIHLVNHHSLESQRRSAWETARRLRPPLVLGALTTMASFAGLALTSFPALRELGLFAMAGVGGALLVTLGVLPEFLPGARPAPALSQRTAALLAAIVDRMAVQRGALVLLVLAIAAGSLLALPRLRWLDDLSRLADIDPELMAEDRRVRARASQLDGSRFVIAMGDDEQAALARNDEVHRRLAPLVAEGGVEGMRSLHALLWSRSLQERNLAAIRSVPALPQRLERVFGEAGFRPGAFEGFRAHLEAPPPTPLLPEDLRRSGMEGLVRSMLLDLGDRAAAITYLRGIRSPRAIEERLADLPDAWLFDQGAFTDSVYAEFREATLRQILVGSVLVIAVLLLRYRSWRPALAAFLPSALVALALLGLFAWLGIETHLLHVVCLIMVMGMGVDYGIFMVDSVRDRATLAATMLSLLLSCLTTVFVFGTLAISSNPALRAMGVTTGLGILLSFLLAPVSLVVTGHGVARDRSRAG